MKTYSSISNFDSKKGTVLTIGTFDGFHIGHQKIVKRVIDVANEKALESLVLTFFPHPRMVLQKESDIKLIHTIAERKEILSTTGLDNLVVQAFTKSFSQMTAEEYVVNVLVKQFNAKHIIIGYDHRFGSGKSADIQDLKKYGRQYGFTVEEISAQEVAAVSVSSTKIRKALLEGDIATANEYLGKPFSFEGVVVKGKQVGTQINYPTANINISESYKLIPANGVYIVQVLIDSCIYQAMMNIGFNPTVNGDKQSIEIHILNFNQDIYDKKLKVTLLTRIRSEQKFDSLATLKAQLNSDKLKTISYFEHN